MSTDGLSTVIPIANRLQERQGLRTLTVERPPELWDGILHEFRNHLTLMLAVGTEIRSALPTEARHQLHETLNDMEVSVHQASLLATSMGVMRGPVEHRKTELGEVVERALALAGPILPPGAEMVIDSSGPLSLPNPGGAVHCALACLLAEMARTAEVAGTRRFTIRLRASAGARLELQSGLPRGFRPSWRLQLARELLARAGGHLDCPTETSPAGCTITFA